MQGVANFIDGQRLVLLELPIGTKGLFFKEAARCWQNRMKVIVRSGAPALWW